MVSALSPVFNLPWVSFSGYIPPEPFSRSAPGHLSAHLEMPAAPAEPEICDPGCD